MKKKMMTLAVAAALAVGAAPAHAQSSSSSLPQTAPSPVTAPDRDTSAVEAEIIRLTNEERATRGLDPLVQDSTLSENSRQWSGQMAGDGNFRHSTGWNVAENIAYTTAPDVDAATFVDMWMNSPGHRANILNPDHTRIGVGLAVSDDGATYATQQFSR
ncbi:CAP domain-containing protein [Corynebacterium halotolerans]|uniref:SCP domain-containing protein n=1 Tax=Corynebacterium halotolerans YIM 70093 = DSM 44683 TaxID=1121362 RepID=M1NPD5_9CORY|nr:CAP domain-containing protein [Corynebacterium halotolerans]AGF73248.1 hypothetical protein A605_11240 [Corynebacterium halotolerans YIM 70093 = DSM 44683]